MRFLKVFAFVLLGLVAASLTTPEGLSALLEPQALIVLLVASTVGALLKAAQWSDVGITDAVPSVTMQLTPPKAVTPPLAEGLAQ
jgi:flagellar motor component MotA